MTKLPKKKTTNKVKFRQVRVTIPTDDPIAIEWINNQRRDASLAIRLLIHRQVKRNGLGNIFATSNAIDDADTDTTIKKPETKTAESKTETENKLAQEPVPKSKPDTSLKDIEDMMG